MEVCQSSSLSDACNAVYLTVQTGTKLVGKTSLMSAWCLSSARIWSLISSICQLLIIQPRLIIDTHLIFPMIGYQTRGFPGMRSIVQSLSSPNHTSLSRIDKLLLHHFEQWIKGLICVQTADPVLLLTSARVQVSKTLVHALNALTSCYQYAVQMDG